MLKRLKLTEKELKLLYIIVRNDLDSIHPSKMSKDVWETKHLIKEKIEKAF